MNIKPPKHSLSLYKITAYREDPLQLLPLDKIPYTDTSTDPHTIHYVDLYDLLQDFFTENKGKILNPPKKSLAYRYMNFTVDKVTRSIITRMDRGSFGTTKEVTNLNTKQAKTQLDTDDIPFEPFYLGLYVPNNKTSAFYLSPKRSNISLKGLFWNDFERYFRKKTGYKINCELFISEDVYKEWMDQEVSQIIAKTTKLGPQVISDSVNDVGFEEYPVFQEIKIIKPQKEYRLPLRKFVRYSENGITLQNNYKNDSAQYEEIKAQVKKDGKQLLFPLKVRNRELEREFIIELPNLEYGVNGHPKLQSVKKEYDSVYQDYKQYLA